MRPVLDAVVTWLRSRAFPFTVISGEDTEPLGIVVGNLDQQADKILCFNACLDTADYGDESKWSLSPTSGMITEGWLYGRGSADSKMAVAIFLHLLEFIDLDDAFAQGRVICFFDCDEHSGEFQGIQRLVAQVPTLDTIAIGYPGEDRLMIGARGFLRATISFSGPSRHSGSRSVTISAIDRAAQAALELGAWSQARAAEGNAVYPKASAVAMNGGTSFAVTADRCEMKVDMRLTPDFTEMAARDLLHEITKRATGGDQTYPAKIDFHPGWPAYVLPDTALIVSAIRSAHREVYNQALNLAVAGPSNIGNFLAGRGIQATCGFGVRYENLHAPNERACIKDAPNVLRVYYRAYKKLMAEWA